ncbi:hypothetical protein KY084_11350 [Stakelama sp. CBK3Z-3]|uniref:Uncharacterized protein n=1 Tax=Stakelama flava TaxID=2860338 RepID=A0ABS6XMN7_9SPHN|nr:hypothetical protein [Stakelama flava]MBW4331462.1 hypothetical protein [Stakelama flava]
MRVLIEVLYIVAGLAAVVLLGWLSAWSYPLGRHDIWLVTGAAVVVVVLMGVWPVMRAYRADRLALDGAGGND